MYFLLFYEAGDDYVERRQPYRSEHLAHGKAAVERGELVLGGAYGDTVDGAVLVFQGDSSKVAEDFARQDPYVLSGVIHRWHVRPWTVVLQAPSIRS
jgi:uncharacterized protein YciI